MTVKKNPPPKKIQKFKNVKKKQQQTNNNQKNLGPADWLTYHCQASKGQQKNITIFGLGLNQYINYDNNDKGLI